MNEFDFLENQGVSAGLIKAAEDFRREFGVSQEAVHRMVKPSLPFYGKETLEMAMAAVLEGENLLLAGPKATGKNVLAEKDHVHILADGVRKLRRQRKIIPFRQCIAAYLAADRFQCRGVFRKRRCQNQRTPWTHGQRKPENQIRRAVSAKHPLRRNTFRPRNRRAQLPTKRIGISIGVICRLADRLRNSRRHAQWADVCRKIQRIPPIFFPIADVIAAMNQFHAPITPRTTTAAASPSTLATRIIRFARRISSGSMGRVASPRVGLS